MHAYLIVGKNKARVDIEIEKLTNKLKSKKTYFEATKVEHIKTLRNFTKLKITEPNVIVLSDIDKASIEASNALLKTLEEPQPELSFILTAENYYLIPETVKSRCQIIKLGGSTDIDSKVIELVHEFLKMKTSQKFIYLEKIKDRESAIDFIKSVIDVTHNDLLNQKDKSYLVKVLEESQKCYAALYANGNVSLQLTAFAVGID